MEPPTVEGITKQLAKLNVGMDRNLETIDECIAKMDKLLSTMDECIKTMDKPLVGFHYPVTEQLEEGFAKLNVGMDRNLETYKPPVMKRIHPMSLSMTKHLDEHWNVCVKGTYGFYFGCPDTGTRVRILEWCCQAFDRLPTSDVYYISTCDTADSGIDPRELRDSLNGYLQEIGLLHPR